MVRSTLNRAAELLIGSGHRLVNLGHSGLKVSKIILGTMQYGSSAWQEWVLDEDEAIKHIGYA